MPITAVIIVVLFAVQRRGTAAVGRLFGPVMIVWFLAIGACGVAGITQHPEILRALSPTYALKFLAGNFGVAFFALAAIVLAVTGAEALYADMGHFGRRAITRGWLGLVLPACVLSYFGQGALILGDQSTVSAPFFLLTPEWGRLPMVLLATAATVIASQAVITGAFSVASQAAQLGYLPRLRIAHTSESTIGQIYVPWINWLLMVSVLTLVFAFRSSAALAYAFGMAVIATITITTLLFFYLARTQWRTPLWLVGRRRGHAAAGRSAVPGREPDQARARRVAAAADRPDRVHRDDHLAARPARSSPASGSGRRARCGRSSTNCTTASRHCCGSPAPRSSSTGTSTTAPLAMRANVEHNQVLHEQVVIIALETLPVPRVPDPERIEIDDLGYAERRDRPRQRPVRLHGTPGRAERAAAARPRTIRRPDRHRRGLLLPVQDRADQGLGPDDGALAQAAVHRDVLHHRRRRRVLRACPASGTVIMGSRIEV